jgi:uncharacterized membrane protein YkvA (DUF1232 family)
MDMKKILNHFIIGGLGVFSIVYLFNPTGGWIELIPDTIPVIGNLDEAAAVTILISCLAYFGFDAGRFFGQKGDKTADDSTKTAQKKAVEAEIIDHS